MKFWSVHYEISFGDSTSWGWCGVEAVDELDAGLDVMGKMGEGVKGYKIVSVMEMPNWRILEARRMDL